MKLLLIKRILLTAMITLMPGVCGAGQGIDAKSSVSNTQNTPALTKLTLTAPKREFLVAHQYINDSYDEGYGTARVYALYDNNQTEEVTDRVEWHSDKEGVRFEDERFFAKPGIYHLYASYKNKNSNTIQLVVHKAPEKNLDVTTQVKGRKAYLSIRLPHTPQSDVMLSIHLDPKDKVSFQTYPPLYIKKLHFTPQDYDEHSPDGWPTRYIEIYTLDPNSKAPYTLYTGSYESNDSYYDGVDPDDITISYKDPADFMVYPPDILERKGAIRGVHIEFVVKSKTYNLKYRLLNPPKGMHIKKRYSAENTEIDGVVIAWDVPMDAIEGNIYTIRLKATNEQGDSKTITFPIKVPKTTPIQTTIKNNELIVTDPNSPLKGMKLKVHEGAQGDISKVRLRSVAYEDVWRHYDKRLDASKSVEHVVFVIDHMPERVDVKLPPYMDTYKKRNKNGAYFDRYFIEMGLITGDYWDWRNGSSYLYEGTNGLSIPKTYYKSEGNGSRVFIFTNNEKL